MNLDEFIKRFQKHNFGENDSVIASSINHPVDATKKALEWLNEQILIASNTPKPSNDEGDIYSYGNSNINQIQSALNLAGLAEVGSMPMAPMSKGGTLGTLTKYGVPDTEYSKAHVLAQKNASLPIEQGGLGLHPNNTAMERAKAMGFDVDNIQFHSSRNIRGKDNNINEFENRIDKTSLFNGLGVHTGSKEAAIHRAEQTRTYDPITGKLRPDESVYYPLIIKKGNYPTDNGNILNEYQAENLLDKIGKNIKSNKSIDRTTTEGKIAIQNEYFNKYDLLPYINDVEDKGNISNISQPKNIRSKFAAFDPMKKNSSNILASGLLASFLLNEMDKK